MRAILDQPLLVVLMGMAALTMLVPALHGFALDDEDIARPFLYGTIIFLVLTALLAIALKGRPGRRGARTQLLSLAGAYLVLPPMFAVPFQEAVGSTTFLRAWFEMVSCFTTTGATMYAEAGRLTDTLHLWRATVGWLGGAFVWVAAVALLAPMNLGGFEVASETGAGQGTVAGAPGFRRGESAARLVIVSGALIPLYAGLTGVLWLLLILAGGTPSAALVAAMATLSTSGVTIPGSGAAGNAGFAGEVAVAAFLLLALSRVTWSGLAQRGQVARLRADPELRLGMLIVAVAAGILFLSHWAEAGVFLGSDLRLAFQALWGALFTVLSFLTTSGTLSDSWTESQGWYGLGTPGVLLMALAVIGGGVGTTAGGVKLLRVWALYLQGRRELERLVHPSSVGGSGPATRRLRRDGAEIAWIFFMLFAMSLGIVTAALALTGLDFERAMVLAVAALSTTGPLAEVGAAAPIVLPLLEDAAVMILMAAMVIGRLETLALIALANPDFWRS